MTHRPESQSKKGKENVSFFILVYFAQNHTFTAITNSNDLTRKLDKTGSTDRIASADARLANTRKH